MYLLNKKYLVCALIMLVAVSAVADAAKKSNRKKNRKRPQANKQKDVDPDIFLEKFGYLGKPPQGVQHDPITRREAIKNFQRMVELDVTGKLDKATRAKMGAPRCGMPDMVPPGTHMPPPGVALDPGNNPQNFYLPGYKWNRTDLTWKLGRRISNDGLSRGAHRRAFSNAFKYWAEHSPLTFREVSGTADINIDFGVGVHGDGVGNAFDGPSGTLAHAFYPQDGRVHFDDDEVWTEKTNDGTDLETVAAHEFGHTMGLGHSNVHGALMMPYYQGYDPDFILPYDDVLAIQNLYGGPPRPSRTTTRRPRPVTTPRPPNSPSERDKDTCTTKFGAVLQAHDTRIYVFNKKWMWRLNSWGVDADYPQNVRKVYPGAPYNMGAAVYSWRTRFTYFFKGKRVWKFYGFSKVQKKKMKSTNAPSSPQSALIGRDGNIYLLQGSKYWIFDESSMDVTSDRARPITDKWRGIPPNIEAAVRLNDGYLYFFKGERYRKYDEYYGRVLQGYPKDKAGPWMGRECGGKYVPK